MRARAREREREREREITLESIAASEPRAILSCNTRANQRCEERAKETRISQKVIGSTVIGGSTANTVIGVSTVIGSRVIGFSTFECEMIVETLVCLPMIAWEKTLEMFVLPREAALGSEGKGDPLLCIQNRLNAMCVCVCVCICM